ncbi:hypothetical protein psyc5s11_15700 [Clostridium gelidum]|uniref:Uncharacterized protein n=1 Tax=Clostridium gelidum TaxID=704125 RepID=A0ABM7T996_9CLOT|nr:hypothetical protein [Clostridium gelidum]BCZ45503.1 hypothetical protein psyc5s11_15700 [Clostridium gelidum]
MKKYFLMENYKKILFGLIIVFILILIMLFCIFYYDYKIKDERLLIILIPELLGITTLFKVKSMLHKNVMEFVYDESILKHPVPSRITREQVIKRVKEKGFETYSVDNMRLGLQLVNIKKNLMEISCCYGFFILGQNIDDENEIIKNEELDRILNNYLKGKEMYRFSTVCPIYCFWAEKLSDKAREKCCKGFDYKKRAFYIGYETSSENLYYAEAMEQIEIPNCKRQAQWIKEIFQIGYSIDSNN